MTRAALRRLRRTAAVGAATLAALVATSGFGNAAAAGPSAKDVTAAGVWPCGSYFCTHTVADTPVHDEIDPAPSPPKYVVPKGQVITVRCYSTERPGIVWYWGGIGDDTTFGYVDGNRMDTGQDPNPQVPLCMG
ncbi:hypothetical protein [Streptomyces sp. CA-132043]|uniref:hypothetical protein n=1 Tax=Streptomyces sp. CA-132043 TaxID=3240048 RepID=UPI003D8E3689